MRSAILSTSFSERVATSQRQLKPLGGKFTFQKGSSARKILPFNYLVKEVFSKKDISNNKYLQEKDIKAYDTLTNDKGQLIVPLKNIDGQVRTFQTINDDGSKYFLSGGQKQGCFHKIGAMNSSTKDIVICEGFATGATIHEATKATVLCAMDAKNLKSVAEAVRDKHENVNIIIAADNDHSKNNNIGKQLKQRRP